MAFRFCFGSLGALVLVGCGTSTTPPTPSADAGLEAAACPPATGTFTCDVSKLTTADVKCGAWARRDAVDSGSISCPGSFTWNASVGGAAGCSYSWKGSDPIDPCSLPPYDGKAGTEWLKAACDAGCP
ncbi:hypothetical protein BH09MYX1_BH09MYX1_52660 [soil metagenome]